MLEFPFRDCFLFVPFLDVCRFAEFRILNPSLLLICGHISVFPLTSSSRFGWQTPDCHLSLAGLFAGYVFGIIWSVWNFEKRGGFVVVLCKPFKCNNNFSITGFVMTFLLAGGSICENSAFSAVLWVHAYLSSSFPLLLISPLETVLPRWETGHSIFNVLLSVFYLDAHPPR